MERDPNEIGALWKKTSKSGGEYYSGYVGEQKVVAFINRKKAINQPDLRILVATRAKSDNSSEDIPF
jgi:uncharacterized protein (DUF736 family)